MDVYKSSDKLDVQKTNRKHMYRSSWSKLELHIYTDAEEGKFHVIGTNTDKR